MLALLCSSHDETEWPKLGFGVFGHFLGCSSPNKEICKRIKLKRRCDLWLAITVGDFNQRVF